MYLKLFQNHCILYLRNVYISFCVLKDLDVWNWIWNLDLVSIIDVKLGF